MHLNFMIFYLPHYLGFSLTVAVWHTPYTGKYIIKRTHFQIISINPNVPYYWALSCLVRWYLCTNIYIFRPEKVWSTQILRFFKLLINEKKIV